jgi:hypothetical protein
VTVHPGCRKVTPPETTPTGRTGVARRDPAPIRELLERNEPPAEPATAWLLCDHVLRMTKTLLPLHEEWDRDPEPRLRGCRPIESGLKTLRSAAV